METKNSAKSSLRVAFSSTYPAEVYIFRLKIGKYLSFSTTRPGENGRAKNYSEEAQPMNVTSQRSVVQKNIQLTFTDMSGVLRYKRVRGNDADG